MHVALFVIAALGAAATDSLVDCPRTIAVEQKPVGEIRQIDCR